MTNDYPYNGDVKDHFIYKNSKNIVIEHDYDIGNNVGRGNVEFSAHLIGKISADKFGFIVNAVKLGICNNINTSAIITSGRSKVTIYSWQQHGASAQYRSYSLGHS